MRLFAINPKCYEADKVREQLETSGPHWVLDANQESSDGDYHLDLLLDNSDEWLRGVGYVLYEIVLEDYEKTELDKEIDTLVDKYQKALRLNEAYNTIKQDFYGDNKESLVETMDDFLRASYSDINNFSKEIRKKASQARNVFPEVIYRARKKDIELCEFGYYYNYQSFFISKGNAEKWNSENGNLFPIEEIKIVDLIKKE